jgi:hypothetical protein
LCVARIFSGPSLNFCKAQAGTLRGGLSALMRRLLSLSVASVLSQAIDLARTLVILETCREIQ